MGAKFIETIWYSEGRAARLVRGLLVPLSWLFALAVGLRILLYRRGWLRSYGVEAPVVSIGNLSVGGTGKTPFVIWLALRLLDADLHPVIVSRGYGGKAGRPVVIHFDPTWTLPQEVGHRVFRPRSYFEALEAAGDEAVLIARRTGCPVVSFADRPEACRTACDCYEPDCLIVDDGFQHLRLERDLDVVILGRREIGAYRLPAGPLREGRGALARADIVVNDCPGPLAPSITRCALGWVASPDAGAQIEALESLQGKAVAAVAAIADPQAFFSMLESVGVDVVARSSFPDHYAYTAQDWDRIKCESAEAGAEMVVTTEKDLVKLERFAGRTASLRALRLAIEVFGGEAIVERIAALDAKRERPHDRPAVGSGHGDAGRRQVASE